MFRSLYARLLVLFMAVLLAAMSLLTVLLYQRIRSDKIEARLNELTIQARDIAFLAGQRTAGAQETNRYLMWKSQEIMRDFDAYILIVDRERNLIPLGDETMEVTYDFTIEETLALLSVVVSGNEIRVPTRLVTGNVVFTVGVPYMQDGVVLGAVFIHTSEQNIEASYRDILEQSLRAMMIALAIGAVMILIISQLITQPLRAMSRAADRFARGDFRQRVRVNSRDEVGLLATSFNSMADELERLEQTRRDFVANVSHELRSPLTSIQGFINGMLDGTVQEEDREHYLSIVLDETRRLNKLITTLLDLSHIESGQTALNITTFDINELISRVLIRQEGRIEAKGIEVEIDFSKDICPVNADPDRIEQVLINLIDNAIKYGKENGTLTLSTGRADGAVRITVADDGPGIPEADLPLVFERFHKVDKAHTKGNGTGLGLAIAKSIIDQHSQRIWVESKEGEGATFIFTLEGA